MRTQWKQVKRKPAIRMVMRKAVAKANFAEVEDAPGAEAQIRHIATIAVRRAAAENRRHGLPAIHVRHNQVISRDAQNRESVIATIQLQQRQYKTGEVFHARKG